MAVFVFDGRTVQDHYPGIGRYAYNLARALADTFPDHYMRLLINPNAYNSRFDLLALATRANVETIPVRARILTPQEQSLGRNPRLLFNASVWHSPYYALPLAMPIPAIVTLGDLTPLVLPEETPNPSKRMLYRVLNYAAARRARAIITYSDASRYDLQRLLRVASEQIFVVPLAADAMFRPSTSVEIANVRVALNLPNIYALYIGSNKPHKNLLRLIEAWAQIQTDAVLIIAGVWDARYPQAKRLVAQRGLQARVLFRHNIPESALPALIAGARLFVFPSVHEGFGLPPLEAMACGTPVACATTSSLPEVVGDAAFVFDPFNVADIAYTLMTLLDNANLRFQLHAKGLEQAQQFSWERTARETMAVYKLAGNFT